MLWNRSVLLLFTINLFSCFCFDLHPNKPTPNRDITQLLSCVVERFVDFDSIVHQTSMILKTDDHRSYTKKFASHVKYVSNKNTSTYGHIMYVETDYRLVTKPQVYVIVADTWPQIRDALVENYKSRNWNARATFIWIVNANVTMSTEHIDFIAQLERLFVANYVVIFTQNNHVRAVRAHVTQCFANVDIIEFTCGSSSNFRVRDERMTNFRQCSVNLRRNNYNHPYYYLTRTNQSSGIFWNIINVMLERVDLNVSAHVLHHPYCDLPADDFLHPRNITCVFPQGLGAFHTWNVLDFMFQDDLVFVVTRESRFEPIWRVVTHVFPTYVWCVQLVLFVGLACVWQWMETITRHVWHVERLSLARRVLSMYAIALSFAIPFRSSLFKLRVLILVWLIYGLHFTVLFQCAYTQILANPKRLHQVLGLHGLIEYKMPIYASEHTIDAIRDIIDDIEVNGTQCHVYNTGNVSNYKDVLRKPGGGAVLISYLSALAFMAMGFFHDEHRHVVVFIPPVERARAITKFRSLSLSVKDHILTDTMNRLIHRMHDHGFTRKIFVDEFATSIATNRLKFANKPRGLTYDDVKSILFVYATGMGACVAFYIGEIVCCRAAMILWRP